jgi:hypothetical protein
MPKCDFAQARREHCQGGNSLLAVDDQAAAVVALGEDENAEEVRVAQRGRPTFPLAVAVLLEEALQGQQRIVPQAAQLCPGPRPRALVEWNVESSGLRHDRSELGALGKDHLQWVCRNLRCGCHSSADVSTIRPLLSA